MKCNPKNHQYLLLLLLSLLFLPTTKAQKMCTFPSGSIARCSGCAKGKYIMEVNLMANRCEDCPKGYYTRSTGRETCPFCPTGYYASNTAATQCNTHTECVAGTHWTTEATDVNDRVCVECNVGRFSTTAKPLSKVCHPVMRSCSAPSVSTWSL